MKAIVFISAFASLVFLGADLSAAPPTAQQQPREEKESKSPEMDGIIKAIHADLVELKKTQPWLAEYNDKCFQIKRISYLPPVRDKSEMLPQQPSHISIGYCPIDLDGEKEFKYSNDLEDVVVCRFPGLKLKIYATVLVRNAKDKNAAEAIRKCIIKQCEAMHKKMDSEKSAKK
jgi:hypothetical protein